MKNADSLTRQSLRWITFARSKGARFNVTRKAADALAFSRGAGARSFAVPSKLEGTTGFQEHIAYALPRLDKSSRKLSAERAPNGRTTVGFGMYTLGYVQRKHECWVQPLVEAGPCLFYLLKVTGGTEDKPIRGVNIAIYNLEEAIQVYAAHMDSASIARLAS